MRYTIIVNPAAGRGAGARAIPRIEQLLRRRGLTFDLVRTERPWHAAELAQQACASGSDVVVAVGGDGTSNEVLNGLMLARQGFGSAIPAMAMLCVGRGNDFAFGVGVPQDLERACDVLSHRRCRAVDIGRVSGGLYPQGRYFGNGVGVGFDAVVGFEAQKIKRLQGFPVYLVAALKTIFLYDRAPLVKIEYASQTLIQPSLLVSVMNGRRMGGGFMMGPNARPDDGLFDLCIARQVRRRRILSLIPHFLSGTQSAQPEITMGQASHVVIEALEGVLPAHADGETICTEGRQLTLEMLPLQVQIVTDLESGG